MWLHETDVFTNGETVMTWRTWASAICQRSASGHSAVGSTPSRTSASTVPASMAASTSSPPPARPQRRAPRSFAPVGSGSTPPRSCRPSACAAAAMVAVSMPSVTTRTGQVAVARGPGSRTSSARACAVPAPEVWRTVPASRSRSEPPGPTIITWAPRRRALRMRRSSTPPRSATSPSPTTTITSARSRSSMRATYGSSSSQAPALATGPEAVRARTSRAMRPQA